MRIKDRRKFFKSLFYLLIRKSLFNVPLLHAVLLDFYWLKSGTTFAAGVVALKVGQILILAAVNLADGFDSKFTSFK